MNFLKKLDKNKAWKYLEFAYITSRIKVKLITVITILKLKLYNLFKKSYGLNTEKRDKKLIVSLTSYPARFNVVYLAIESLMNQSMRPDRIILWLSLEESNRIPDKVLSLKNRGLEIEIVNENLKSYKKLIYALKKFPNENIITCNDDTIYPKDFIEKLYKKHNEYPICIIGYNCSVILKSGDNTLYSYLSWPSPGSSSPSLNLFPVGVGGILYPSNSLSDIVFDQELFLKLAPFGDDIWFKAAALLKGTKVAMVNKCVTEFPVIIGSQKSSLWDINKNKNDKQLKNVFDHFDLYKYLE